MCGFRLIYLLYSPGGLNISCVTGPAAIQDCQGRVDGDYQNCYRCDVYSHCTNQALTIIPCAPGTFFDANITQCQNTSTTCAVTGKIQI